MHKYYAKILRNNKIIPQSLNKIYQMVNEK